MEAGMAAVKRISLVLFFCLVFESVEAQRVSGLEGAWELVSQKVDGTDL
jgi:hypothetical protein